MKLTHKHWTPLIVCVTLAAGLWVGYLLGKGPGNDPAQEKLNMVFDLIRYQYVDEVGLDSLVEMTIPRMLSNLDPHSAYIPASEVEAANRELESSFFGIGITFNIIDDTVRVMEVIGGGPSEKAGLLPGDRIIAVDGENITGPKHSMDDIAHRLRGEKDTKVNVTVRRLTSRKPLTFEITRGLIPATSIDAAYMVNDSVGYVKVGKFARDTYMEFLHAINKLRLSGAQSFVVDLRGNTGGFMGPAVLMANEFLPYGRKIVERRGRVASENEVQISDGTGSFADYRLVVLIDEFTASASEIFSGAIQDNDAGMIIGRRSFGKGLVQSSIDFPDSSQVRLTVQRYYTPSGRCIQKIYERGENSAYESEIMERYNRGEVFNADSIPFNSEDHFTTYRGRTVYGGGGIIPDVFVPGDTTGVTPYYISVANQGLLIKYAHEYTDLNRQDLEKYDTLESLMNALPSNYVLLTSFLNYASSHGVPTRPYYVNISRDLIVNQLKALIARDMLGSNAYYQVINQTDNVVNQALRQISDGNVEQITQFNDPA